MDQNPKLVGKLEIVFEGPVHKLVRALNSFVGEYSYSVPDGCTVRDIEIYGMRLEEADENEERDGD